MLADWAAEDGIFLRGPSDCGDLGGGRSAVVPPGELLEGDALKGGGPLGPPAPALDSPSCCTLRQSELERLCLAGLHPLVAAVSAGQPASWVGKNKHGSNKTHATRRLRVWEKHCSIMRRCARAGDNVVQCYPGLKHLTERLIRWQM